MSAVSTGEVIEKANYTHKALIDQIVMNPAVTQRELAAHFGYTEGWMSRILRSDALRELLAERKAELFDPVVLQGIEKRMEALALQSLEVIEENLQIHRSSDTAMKALELSTRALGYGAKQPQVALVQNFVVAMPAKSADSAQWASAHAPQRQVVEAEVVPAGGRGQDRPGANLTIDTQIG